jgi:MATE family multidrug resistance protein
MMSMRREILRLAWPVFIAQLAVMANGVIDTVMAGRLSPVDLAAMGLGASIYVTVYIGLMGTLLGLSPIIGQHFGAGRYNQIGDAFRQSLWLALGLAVPGCLALIYSDVFLAFSAPPAEVAEVTRGYLLAISAGLPAALLFRAFSSMNVAISRPHVVMLINLSGLALKFPLNTLFMYGSESLGIAPMGGAGCGVATAVLAWMIALVSVGWLLLDSHYARFSLLRWSWPDLAQLRELLRLGLPIGAAYMVEITSFTFMALFVARLGPTAAASHQIAANLAGICYMVGLGIAHATSTLVAHSIGAEERQRARQYALNGFRMALLAALATVSVLWFGSSHIAALYSTDHAVITASVPLIALVALFHLFDSLQTQVGYVLRAYKVSTSPMVVYLVAMWGIGIGGGYLLTFLLPEDSVLAPFGTEAHGAMGFWVAGFVSLILATIGLAALLVRLWRREQRTSQAQ